MTDAWDGRSKEGEPKRSGWHFWGIKRPGFPAIPHVPNEWHADDGERGGSWEEELPPLIDPTWEWVYLGPCLTTAEVAARIAEAVAQEREACAAIADEHHKSAKRGAAAEWGYPDSAATRARIEARAYEAFRIAAAIRARKDSTP
jgi:hypothetical protein